MVNWMENPSVTGVPNNRDRDRDEDQERLTICVKRIAELEATVARLTQEKADERARVIATLRKYTSHVSTCAIRYRAECSCGLFDALNEPHAPATERDEGEL